MKLQTRRINYLVEELQTLGAFEQKTNQEVSTNDGSVKSDELKSWQVETDAKTEIRRRNCRNLERRKFFTAALQNKDPIVTTFVAALPKKPSKSEEEGAQLVQSLTFQLDPQKSQKLQAPVSQSEINRLFCNQNKENEKFVPTIVNLDEMLLSEQSPRASSFAKKSSEGSKNFISYQ